MHPTHHGLYVSQIIRSWDSASPVHSIIVSTLWHQGR